MAFGGRGSAGAVVGGSRFRVVPGRVGASAEAFGSGKRRPPALRRGADVQGAIVRQTLYALSDEQTEYQLCDRLSFRRFVGLALHEPVPDAKTIWLYREQLYAPAV